MDERQSTLIKAMRFPLIVMVVFAHSARYFDSPTVEWSLDGWNVYHFVVEMLSRHLFSIGTCWFFVFSGYFFLRYLKEEDFSLQWVAAKWKKRIWTLLIPYLTWNLLSVISNIVKNSVFSFLNIGETPENWIHELDTPLYWFITGPADPPLWFLRDLILLSLAAPLLYLFFKRFKWVSLAVLILIYLIPWNPPLITIRSLFFFPLGAWLGTHKINMLSVCRKVKVPAYIAAGVLLLVATSQIGRPLHTLLLRLFYPCGMISFMNICDALIDNERLCQRLCDLSGSVFFIYAAHEIYILGWSKGLCLRVFGESLAGTWICYFLAPIITLAACYALYCLLNKTMPRALAFACGGRSKK